MATLRIIQQYWKYLTLFILLIITCLSVFPLQTLPTAPGSDKTHHLIAYFFLAFPSGLRRPKKWVLLICLFIIFGGIIEIIQPYVNRYGEWLDFFANTTGVILGFFVGMVTKVKLLHNIR